MNDLTRYEKELADELKRLSLPDKNGEWEEMKKLLDKDDDDTIVPPPAFNSWFRRSAYVMILLLIIAVSWFYINNAGKKDASRQLTKNETGAPDNNIPGKEIQENNNGRITVEPTTGKSIEISKGNKDIQNSKDPVSKNDHTGTSQSTVVNQDKQKDKPASKKNTKVGSTSINASIALTTNANNSKKSIPKNTAGKKMPAGNLQGNIVNGKGKRKVKNGKANFDINTSNGNADEDETKTTVHRKGKKFHTRDSSSLKITGAELDEAAVANVSKQQNDLSEEIKQDDTANKTIAQSKEIVSVAAKTVVNDSINKRSIATTVTDDSKKENAKKKTNKKKPGAYFTVGVSEQQAIRSDCNCEYPGSNYKNKFAVKDYIPSVYVRYYSKKKWFAQAEFKYAAPHYVREFLFEKQVKEEPFNYITKSAVLKRTYFHELSLSFHYFIIPHLSAGVGIKYNIFSSGTIQADEKKKLYGIGADSLISSNITKQRSGNGTHDFYNTINLLFEMQYQWKRFSLGGRYAIGLQPYVKYTDPNIKSSQNKKGNSFNLFLRYDLGRLKMK